MTAPTLAQYGDFQEAFQHFNLELFGGALPDTMLTLARTRHATGYVIPDGFHLRGDKGGEKTPEIGLNPLRFAALEAPEVLSMLAVEMIKLAQHAAGTGSPDNYLNKDFHRRAAAIGLTVTGAGYELAEGGQLDAAIAHLIANGWAVRYVAPVLTKEQADRKAARKASKTKYTCPITGLNAWAKPGAVLYTREGADAGQPMTAEE